MHAADFPDYRDSPRCLFDLDANCGPLSAWMLLKYFRKRTSTERLLRACGYNKRVGTHTIGLASALQGFGLKTEFFSEPDGCVGRSESALYRRASEAGVTLCPAMPLESLVERVRDGGVGIVHYQADHGAHFSPVIGICGERIILPYSDDDGMSIREFGQRWNAQDILRQCLFVVR